MSKAENFTIRVDEELKDRMKAHPEINWSHVIREHVRGVLEDLERMDELATESTLSEADVEEIAAMIDKAAAERAERNLAKTDSETDAPDEPATRDGPPERSNVTDGDTR